MSSRLTSEVQQSRSRLLLSLQAEIEELRQEILKKKSDHLLDVNTARRGQRTSFVEYVSEVYNRHHGPHSSTSTLSSGQKDIGRGDVTTWRSVRPASSGSRYKYTEEQSMPGIEIQDISLEENTQLFEKLVQGFGFRRKNVGRRTSYAGETVDPDINDVKINATSTSEPRLFRKGTVLRNRNRYNPTSVCENPGGSNPSGDKEVQGAPGAAGGAAGAAGAGGGGGQEAEEGNTEDGMTRRLQRMKVRRFYFIDADSANEMPITSMRILAYNRSYPKTVLGPVSTLCPVPGYDVR
ncbi:uncharacterized protein LOC111714819 [Eurytemora carolleeae]|uniref:uncharacterized protein LOC111714819 n=1 Tax=Eurytemora carolleeae TaxID=1294199 RepID=UPI000C794E53|nr:uncharacterized protein LOC111714819 [Eurytemora carolleeae]|eukprot:XP_023345790.1 uncharacterized protein LOC111714819 [Eurytemora affinis]